MKRSFPLNTAVWVFWQHIYWQMHRLTWGLIIWVRTAKGQDPIQFNSLPSLLVLWYHLSGWRCYMKSWIWKIHSYWPAPLAQEVPKSKGQGRCWFELFVWAKKHCEIQPNACPGSSRICFFRCPTTARVSLAHGQSRSIINKVESVCP